MKKIILLFFFNFFLFVANLQANSNKNYENLLLNSKIYIDKTRKMNFESIKKQKFEVNKKEYLAYGYSPNFDVWLKFTISNNTKKDLLKVLEYANALTTNLEFYSPKEKVIKEGLFFVDKNRKNLNPAFKISLKAGESKTYYLKASSYITTLIIKLKLWDSDAFYANEINHQIILSLFFGAMIILGIYNLFIFFFTRDLSYLYYVLYIFGITFHHFMYVGFSYVYLLDVKNIPILIELAPLIVAMPIFALALFTKSFLNIKQYRVLNIILNIGISIIPLSILIILFTDYIDHLRNLILLFVLIYLVFITVYASIKKNRQAYFILLSWFIIFTAILMMYLSSSGIYNIYAYFPYIVEIALLLEVIIFSVALADRINYLQKEKNEASKKLFLQEQSEKIRLETTVSEKTNDLKIALDEKGLLLKELNHRVKNNMQTIVSLIRLQSDDIKDQQVLDLFTTIQNRINAMSHLHEMLYKQDNVSHVDANEYFELLIDELKDSYENAINIEFDIKTNLKMEEAVYCGLILNELVSNSFKHAFPNKEEGKVFVFLDEKNGVFHLAVSDDGIGYNVETEDNTLGLTLVQTLAEDQLKGNIKINSLNGVKVDIVWNDNE